MDLFNSIKWYCMNMVVFVIYFVAWYKAFSTIIFEVQTYKNSNFQIDITPRGSSIFFKWFAGVFGAGLILLMAYLYIPAALCVPSVIAGESIGAVGEALSQYKEVIALLWLAICIVLLVITGKRLLESLTRRVKKKKKKVEIFLYGKEYSLLLLAQAFVTCMCFLILLGAIVGNYNDTIGMAWKIFVWVDYILLIINGVFIHQKLYIFDNGLVTYQKYRKAGFGQKEDLEILVDESNKMIMKMKGEELFILDYLPKEKSVIEELSK